MLPWDPCTYFLSYLQILGSTPFSLRSVYCIGICVTALGSVTVHQDMIGMPRHHTFHMEHSELASLLIHMHHYSLLGSHMRVYPCIGGLLGGGYRSLWWLQGVRLTTG
jgi:hypothetical protein